MRMSHGSWHRWVGVVFGGAFFTLGADLASGQCNTGSELPSPVNPQIVAAAYDSVRGQTVALDDRGTTWGWDGTAYTVLAEDGPPDRIDTAMVFDNARGVTVLFGGLTTDGQVPLGDTWEWDGSTWTQRVLSGPGARSKHAMAFDSARGVTVLFGGTRPPPGQVLATDTWEYNGSAWVRRSTGGGPPGNTGTTLVYDAARGVCVAVGGDVAITAIWEWNGVEWAEVDGLVTPMTPKKAGGVFDPALGKVLIVPGTGSSSLGTWSYDGAAWVQLDTAPLGRENLNKIAYDSARGRPVLIAPGTPQASAGAVWERAAGMWFRAYDAYLVRGGYGQPRPAYDIKRNVVIAQFGSRTWEYDGAIWRSIAPMPMSSPVAVALAYDPAHERTVLLGVKLSGELETWSWDGTAWQKLEIPTPAGPPGQLIPWRIGYDEQRGTLLALLSTAMGLGSRLWELDGLTWREVDTPGLDPIATECNWIYDPRRAVWVLSGAGSGDECWEWDGAVWTQRSEIGGPTARAGQASWFDPIAGVVTVAGGYDEVEGGFPVPVTDVWTWDGVEWTQLEPYPDELWMLTANTVYYPPADGLLQQRGNDYGQFLHVSRPTINTHPVDVLVAPGGRLELTIGVSSGSPYTVRWRRNGTTLEDKGPVSGATTTTLVIDPAGPADAGVYEAVVNDACGVGVSRRATVTVGCGPAEWTGDGVVNSTDVSEFINDWFEDQAMGTLVTDFNDDGVSNSTDVSDFINAWFAAPEACR